MTAIVLDTRVLAFLSCRPSQSRPTRHPSSPRRNRSPGAEKGYAPTDSCTHCTAPSCHDATESKGTSDATILSSTLLLSIRSLALLRSSLKPLTSRHAGILWNVSLCPSLPVLRLYGPEPRWLDSGFAAPVLAHVWRQEYALGSLLGEVLKGVYTYRFKKVPNLSCVQFYYLLRYLGQLIIVAADVHGIGYRTCRYTVHVQFLRTNTF